MIDLPVVRLDPELPLPRYARHGDAGLDLVAVADGSIAPGGGRLQVHTGLKVAIPLGYAGFILPRSGLAARNGVTLSNAPGLIDSGYRGELIVPMVNHDPEQEFEVKRGDRIAQLVIQRVEEVRWMESAILEESERAEGGFGHSGVAVTEVAGA